MFWKVLICWEVKLTLRFLFKAICFLEIKFICLFIYFAKYVKNMIKSGNCCKFILNRVGNSCQLKGWHWTTSQRLLTNSQILILLTMLLIWDKCHDFMWLLTSTGHRTIEAKGQYRLLQKHVFSIKTDVGSTYPWPPTIMSHDFLTTWGIHSWCDDPLISWSRGVTRETESFESPLSQDLCSPNFAWWWFIKWKTHPQCQVNLWWYGH